MKIESSEAERFLKLINDSLEGGKGFVLEQAPDVVQQLILWKRVESIVIVALLAVTALVALCLARSWSAKVDWDSAATEGYVYASVSGCFVFASCLIAALIVAVYSLEVWLAPKVYVLHYLSGFEYSSLEDPVAFTSPALGWEVTENAVAELVPMQPACRDAQDSVIRCRHRMDILQAAVTSLDNRKKALEKLVELRLADYYSKPRAPKGAKEKMGEVEKRAVRRRGRERTDDD